MTTTPRSDNYALDEVRAIAELYEEVWAADRMFALVRLIDFRAAMRRLNPTLRAAVVVVSIYGCTTRQAEKVLGVTYSAAWKRNERGLEKLVEIMNGRP